MPHRYRRSQGRCEVIASSRYDNGVRLVSCHLPTRNVALGIWLVAGPRHESPAESGYTHLMEHLLFRGCRDRGGAAIAREVDALGGQINAFTGRESMSLRGLVAREDLSGLVALFLAMLLTPRFDDADVAGEREVVLHECAWNERALDDDGAAFAWSRHPLGRSVFGDRAVLATATGSALRDYWHRTLSGARLAIVAAGAVDHTDLERLCAPLADLPTGAIPVSTSPIFAAEQTVRDRDEVPLRWIMPAPGFRHRDFTVSLLANQILGGGLASRLFADVRTRAGLAYSVHSRLETYSDAGLWLIEADCAEFGATRCAEAIDASMARLATTGPDAQEIAVARRRLIAGLRIEDADPEAAMGRLALEILYLGRHPGIDERTAQLAHIDADAVTALLRDARAHVVRPRV